MLSSGGRAESGAWEESRSPGEELAPRAELHELRAALLGNALCSPLARVRRHLGSLPGAPGAGPAAAPPLPPGLRRRPRERGAETEGPGCRPGASSRFLGLCCPRVLQWLPCPLCLPPEPSLRGAGWSEGAVPHIRGAYGPLY